MYESYESYLPKVSENPWKSSNYGRRSEDHIDSIKGNNKTLISERTQTIFEFHNRPTISNAIGSKNILTSQLNQVVDKQAMTDVEDCRRSQLCGNSTTIGLWKSIRLHQLKLDNDWTTSKWPSITSFDA